MTVSIVIATHNGEDTIARQLTAVQRSCSGLGEIIVVDNLSTDATVAVASSFPQVRVLSCTKRGRCAARNVGVRAARFDKILLCDQDDVVSDGWVPTMSRALDIDDVVGGELEFESLNDQFVRATRVNRHTGGLPNRDGVLQPIGANMGFQRVVFDAIDGFDEDFLMGAEDTDFTYRASLLGFSVGFARGALVAYRLRADRRAASRQVHEYVRAGVQFRVKHHVAQPWKSQVLRAWNHVRNLSQVWRCGTRAGRFAYSQDLAAARAAWVGFRAHRIVGG